MRFRNDEHPRHINDLGIAVGPNEEYEWPGWARGTHGHPPTGSVLLDPEPADDGSDPPKRARRTRPSSDPPDGSEQSANGTEGDPPQPNPPNPADPAATA